MIWVTSEHEKIKKLDNKLPFIGQLILLVLAIIPPVVLTQLFDSFYHFENIILGRTYISTSMIWFHILWRFDFKIIVYFIPAWFLLLILFIASFV